MFLLFAGNPSSSSNDDESDDSWSDDIFTKHHYHGPSQIVVRGAGHSAVNGVYLRDGAFEGASKFSREGEYDGKPCKFSVFRCQVTDNKKHWFISIVPLGCIPGTHEDIDFYSAPVTKTCRKLPPLSGWRRSNEGHYPAPMVLFTDHEKKDIPDDQGPRNIVVRGAGRSAVNGVYLRDGVFEGAGKFSREGEYGGKPCNFSIFQCKVSNNTKHWYLSIVPTGCTPGTRDDTDFYSAPVTETCRKFPPLSGWTKSNEGLDPPPKVLFTVHEKKGMPDDQGPSIGRIVVSGAGHSAVNGVYLRDGVFEGANKFCRQGEYGGKRCNFSVFQCRVSNNTKHWYISIVPTGCIPGTQDDTDFYSAPVTEKCMDFPPLRGWTKSNYGLDPPPTVS